MLLGVTGLEPVTLSLQKHETALRRARLGSADQGVVENGEEGVEVKTGDPEEPPVVYCLNCVLQINAFDEAGLDRHMPAGTGWRVQE